MAREEITPMMKQFYDFKAKYPDALLLFRCGDFYETYAEDASIAADILGITLTRLLKNSCKQDSHILYLLDFRQGCIFR